MCRVIQNGNGDSERFAPRFTAVHCPGVIHFALVCGSLSHRTFRTRVALRRATKNIEIRGRPRVANELVDGLERLIVLRKANERTT